MAMDEYLHSLSWQELNEAYIAWSGRLLADHPVLRDLAAEIDRRREAALVIEREDDDGA